MLRLALLVDGFANIGAHNYALYLYIRLLLMFFYSFFTISANFKDRILTKVSASKALPTHVKSLFKNQAITTPFWIRSTLLGNKHGCSRALSRTCVLPIRTGRPMLIVTMRLKT